MAKCSKFEAAAECHSRAGSVSVSYYGSPAVISRCENQLSYVRCFPTEMRRQLLILDNICVFNLLLITPLNAAFLLCNIYKLSPNLTGNTLHLRYKRPNSSYCSRQRSLFFCENHVKRTKALGGRNAEFSMLQ
jgi:hypothetical protein